MKRFLIPGLVVAAALAFLPLLPRPGAAPAQAPPERDADARAALALSAPKPPQAPAAKKPYDGPCACGNGCPCGNSCGCATTAGCSGKGECDCTSRVTRKDPRVCTHCICGCTETGHCDCKDCDHPKLAPAEKKAAGLSYGAARRKAVDESRTLFVWVGGMACPYCEEGFPEAVHCHVPDLPTHDYWGAQTPRLVVGRPDGKGDLDQVVTLDGSMSCERIRAALARPAAGSSPPAGSAGFVAPPVFFGGFGGGCPGGACGGGGCGPGGCGSCGGRRR